MTEQPTVTQKTAQILQKISVPRQCWIVINVALFAFLLSACTTTLSPFSAPRLREPRIDRALFPNKGSSTSEKFCAWFGDTRKGVLHFGVSAFWNEYWRDGSDPLADLKQNGPLWIGRYDLAQLKFLPPLTVAAEGAPTGSWDVLAHPNGRIYFSSLFDFSGFVDPHSGEVKRFHEAGLGLNELALGPDKKILASRYAAEETGQGGSVVLLSEEGEIEKEFSLSAPLGYLTSPKTVAYDASTQKIWVVSDLIPRSTPTSSPTKSGPPAKVRYDARVLDLQGRELHTVEMPEVFFVRFDARGAGYLALRNANRLELQTLPPRTALPTDTELDDAALRNLGPRIVLNENFSPYDFVQDITLHADQVVLTSWNGEVHIVDARGKAKQIQLPNSDGNGLYYTGVIHGKNLCATYCSDVAVTCAPLP